MSDHVFPDPRLLIGANELASRVSEVTLLDLRPAENFALGRIPGAGHVDIYGVSLSDSSPEPLSAFLKIFPVLFGSRGVSRDRPVVIYDHESGERASRAVWLLMVLGHPNVRLLDGGTQAWLAAGHALERVVEAPPHPDPAKAPPTPPPFKVDLQMSMLATRLDVMAAIDNPTSVIIDVRRESEYRGTEKRARRVGTIPGAVHVFWREHINKHGALKSPALIRELYESRGVTPDRTVIPVCHGGYRSASTFIVLKSLGYPDVRNYVSSWGEWGNREDTRVVVPA